MSVVTFWTAPWLRILWISIPKIYLYLGKNVTFEEANDLNFINIFAEVWVVPPLILFMAAYMSFSRNFEVSARSKHIFKKNGFEIFIYSLLSLTFIAVISYERFIRFFINDSDFLQLLMSSVDPHQIANEYSVSKNVYFPSSECLEFFNSNSAGCLPCYLNLVYLFLMICNAILFPVLFYFISDLKTPRNILFPIFYVNQLLAAASLFSILFVNPTGEFGGLLHLSTRLYEIFALVFTASVSLIFYMKGKSIQCKNWMRYCFACSFSFTLWKWIILPVLSYFIVELSLEENLILCENIYATLPIFTTYAYAISYSPVKTSAEKNKVN